jgi:hypothetical protein
LQTRFKLASEIDRVAHPVLDGAGLAATFAGALPKISALHPASSKISAINLNFSVVTYRRPVEHIRRCF